MENMKNDRPVFNGLLESSVYEGKLVKSVFMPARQAGWSNSYRLLFLVEGLMINGVEHVYFVNCFINDRYNSGSKTARFLQALGVTELKGTVSQEDLDNLKGRKVRMYLEPGKEYFSQKLQRNVQTMEIVSMNPVNRTVPNPVQEKEQKPFIVQQTQVAPQIVSASPVVQQVKAPVQVATKPVQQVPQAFATPVKQPVQNGAWNSNGTPMSVSNAASIVNKPTIIPASQPAHPLGETAVKQDYAAKPVATVVEQPLPTNTFVPEELEF